MPTALPSPFALALKSSEQPLTVQATLPHLKASKGPSLVGDQGQGAEVAKDKGKGKEIKLLSEAKDPAKAKDAAAKAKEVEAKPKKADLVAKDASAS